MKEIAEGIEQSVKMKTGTYTGDGTTSQAITGVGFRPKLVIIWKHVTAHDYGDFIAEKTDTMNTQFAVIHGGTGGTGTGEHEAMDNRLVSLDADGFTVDDDGADKFPNTNAVQYDYLALGLGD